VDAIGDTVARLQGPVTPGVHTVTWNYGLTRGTVAAAPLSPSARRDSILRAVRGPKVLDSLAAAKYDSAALAAARPLILGTGAPAGGGGFGGGGGGGGGAGGAACERPLTQWDPFCARPGEGLVANPGLAAPAAGGGRGGAAITPAVRKIFELVGLQPPAGGGRGGFGGFGGGGGSATTGDYGVVLRIGDQVFTQKLRVEDVGMSGWAAMYGGNR
jgi:hypothetical protein